MHVNPTTSSAKVLLHSVHCSPSRPHRYSVGHAPPPPPPPPHPPIYDLSRSNDNALHHSALDDTSKGYHCCQRGLLHDLQHGTAKTNHNGALTDNIEGFSGSLYDLPDSNARWHHDKGAARGESSNEAEHWTPACMQIPLQRDCCTQSICGIYPKTPAPYANAATMAYT